MLSLDVKAVGLLRHGERIWASGMCVKGGETVGRDVAAGLVWRYRQRTISKLNVA